MLKPSTLVRLAAVGVAVTAIAACTPRRPVETGAGETPPPVGPQYPPVNNGTVDGGNLGAAAPGYPLRSLPRQSETRTCCLRTSRTSTLPKGVSRNKVTKSDRATSQKRTSQPVNEPTNQRAN